jgi:hypothetical protein
VNDALGSHLVDLLDRDTELGLAGSRIARGSDGVNFLDLSLDHRLTSAITQVVLDRLTISFLGAFDISHGLLGILNDASTDNPEQLRCGESSFMTHFLDFV